MMGMIEQYGLVAKEYLDDVQDPGIFFSKIMSSLFSHVLSCHSVAC